MRQIKRSRASTRYTRYWFDDSISKLSGEPPFNIEFDVNLNECLVRLITDRIIKKRWIWKDDMPKEPRNNKTSNMPSGKITAPDKNPEKRYAEWYISRPPVDFMDFFTRRWKEMNRPS